jgi:hypothetical protein
LIELLAAHDPGRVGQIMLAMVGAAAHQHLMKQHIFRRKNCHRRAEQRHPPQPHDHHIVEHKWVDRATTPDGQIVEDLNAAPEDALAIELDRLLLLLKQLDNIGELARHHQHVDILDRPAVAVQVCRHARADAPFHLIGIQQTLHHAQVTRDE